MNANEYGGVVDILSDALGRGSIQLLNGESRAITHNVTFPEALQLAATVQRLGCRSTAETGMAYGTLLWQFAPHSEASALTSQAMSRLTRTSRRNTVAPRWPSYGNTALKNIAG